MTQEGEGGGGKVAVIGAGTMGHGIAQVAAMAGHPVALFDPAAGAVGSALGRIRSDLEKGLARGKLPPGTDATVLSRIGPADTLEAAASGAAVVIEAIPEDLALKEDLFRRLDRVAPERALLASNTSALSLARIAAATTRPERVIGLHFFNPAPRMRLLEIVKGPRTSEATVAAALDFARGLGKDPIVVNDSPGFATSRLGVALGLEAMRMLEEGVASAEDIDRAMEMGYGHPMGPLRVSDLVGLDVRLSIARGLAAELKSARFEPPRILEEKVKAGKLGRKTGEGFFVWPEK